MKRGLRRGLIIAAFGALALVGAVYYLSWPVRFPEFVSPASPSEPVTTFGHRVTERCVNVPALGPEPLRARLVVRSLNVDRTGGQTSLQAIVRSDGRAKPGPEALLRLRGREARVVLSVPPVREPARVCIRGRSGESAQLLGIGATPALRLERAKSQPRLLLLADLLRRLSLGAAIALPPAGAITLLLLTGCALSIALLILLRTLFSRTFNSHRKTIAGLLVLAWAHAALWALLVPPFQVPDEQVHYAYAVYLAQHGTGPSTRGRFTDLASPQEAAIHAAFQTGSVAFNPSGRPPWSDQLRHQIDQVTALSNTMADVSTNATGQPPLYYFSLALPAVIFKTVPQQLLLMRMISALWFALLVLALYAFIGELQPGRPRLALAVGIAAALFPLGAFLGGGVNPDVALAALVAVTLFLGLRLICYGGRWLAALLGLGIACLSLVKLTGSALAPAFLFFAILGTLRHLRRHGGWSALRSTAAFIIGIGMPMLLYTAWSLVSSRPLLARAVTDQASAVAGSTSVAGRSVREFLSWAWQLYLPRMPWQQDLIPGQPLKDVWLSGLAGRFGYLDYATPSWTKVVVAVMFICVLGLAALTWARNHAQRDRQCSVLHDRRVRALAAVLPVMTGILLVVIAWADYTSVKAGGPPFRQARYLLPLLPAFFALVPAAVKSVPVRLRRGVGVMGIGVCVLWAASALAATINRYWL